jgi:hypothetical protein
MCSVEHCTNVNYTNSSYQSNYCKTHEFCKVETVCELCKTKKWIMRYITKCEGCKMKLHTQEWNPIIVPTFIYKPK